MGGVTESVPSLLGNFYSWVCEESVLQRLDNIAYFLDCSGIDTLFPWRLGVMCHLWLESDFAVNQGVIPVTFGVLKRLRHENISQVFAFHGDQI